MFAVITCNKYHRRTIRVANLGDADPESLLDMQMGECRICGPCSHVEVGTCRGWWHIVPVDGGEDAATELAWSMAQDAPETYDTSYLPELEIA